MPESLSVLLHDKLYAKLSASSKLFWKKNVVEPFKVLISVGFVTYSFTLGVFLFAFFPIIVLLLATVIRSYCCHGFVLAYLLWFMYDYQTPQNGRGRSSEWLRHSYIFKKLVNEYFSMKIVRMGTSSCLNPNKNYMIGYHPHGNAPVGYFCGFGTEAASFSEQFPHHDRHLFNHNIMFFLPFIRELQIAWGCHTVDRRVLDKVMSRYTDNNFSKTKNSKSNDNNQRTMDGANLTKMKSSLFVIVPGGIDEMMKVQPGILDLTIKNRKGFVKQAIRYGTDLVPAIGFGETELWGVYRPPKGSILFTIQDLARKYLSRFSLNYPIGSGLTPGSWGILPHRKPITIVLGNIVPVKRDLEPASDYVDMVHEKYVSEIERLFKGAKDKYGPAGYELVLH